MVDEVTGQEEDFLSIEDIETKNDTKYDVIEAWGGKVRVVSLNAEDMIEWYEANDTPAKKTAGIRIFVKSIVDKNGRNIGTSKHVEVLKKKSFGEILKVVNCILKLNGLNTADEKKEKNG